MCYNSIYLRNRIFSASFPFPHLPGYSFDYIIFEIFFQYGKRKRKERKFEMHCATFCLSIRHVCRIRFLFGSIGATGGGGNL